MQRRARAGGGPRVALAGVAPRARSASSAAAIGVPRLLARAAASSRAPAISVSGPSVESARWRARSSGSAPTKSEASMCPPSLVRGDAVVDHRREQRVCEANRPVRDLDHTGGEGGIEDALGDVEGRRKQPRWTDGQRPLRATATLEFPAAAGRDVHAPGPPSDSGMGSGPRGSTLRSATAQLQRVEGVAAGRLVHPHERRARERPGEARLKSWWCGRRDSAGRRGRPSDGIEARVRDAAAAVSPTRRTRAAGPRRVQPPHREGRALADGVSSHWTSSIASTIGPSLGENLQRATDRYPKRPGVDRRARVLPRSSNAISNARRRGACNSCRTSPRASSKRSPRPAYGTPRSTSAGLNEGRGSRVGEQPRPPRPRASTSRCPARPRGR